MKIKTLIFIAMVLALLGGTISVYGSSSGLKPAEQPWTLKTIDEDEPQVQNLSTAFVGPNQVPMMSYSRTGKHIIFKAHPATSALPGNCGPGDSWYCGYAWEDVDLIPGTVSNIATYRYSPDKFEVSWVYATTSGKLRGGTIELMNNMEVYGSSWVDLIDMSKFLGNQIIGAPSLLNIGGRYRMAVTICGGMSGCKLVYMYYTGVENDSCTASGTSEYQCDVIDYTTTSGIIGAPSLQIVSGEVGIAYSKSGVMYAYPWTSVSDPNRLPNCGPGESTWRCIKIKESSVADGIVKLDFGKTSNDRGIAWANENDPYDFLASAKYVGSGGDCGQDGTTYMWDCEPVDLMDETDIDAPQFSIAVDPDGYPVIAYQRGGGLWLASPNARFDIPYFGWKYQDIDTSAVSAGAQAALSFNNAGFGFIGYQAIYYHDDKVWEELKGAFQYFDVFLPLITR